MLPPRRGAGQLAEGSVILRRLNEDSSILIPTFRGGASRGASPSAWSP